MSETTNSDNNTNSTSNFIIPEDLKQSLYDISKQNLIDTSEFFTDETGEPYITILYGGIYRTFHIVHPGFRHYYESIMIRHAHHQLSESVMKEDIGSFQTRAKCSGVVHSVHIRSAFIDGKLYVDHADTDYNITCVSESGRETSNQFHKIVKFRRGTGSLPIPLLNPPDSSNFGVGILQSIANIPDDNMARLLFSAAAFSLMPGTHPVIVIASRTDSGKSTAAKVLRHIADPSSSPLIGPFTSERETFLAASNSRTLIIDNLPAISQSLSDNICRIIDGVSYRSRKNYTDYEETVYTPKNCTVILTSIYPDLIKRADLGSRSITIELPCINPNQRKTSKEVDFLLNINHTELITTALDYIQLYLANIKRIGPPLAMPRMADFYLFIYVLGKCLNWPPNSILSTYTKNRREISDSIIEQQVITRHVINFMSARDAWVGTATDLQIEFNRIVPKNEREQKEWPDTVEKLGRAVRSIEVGLEEYGIYTQHRRINGGNRSKTINFSKTIPITE